MSPRLHLPRGLVEEEFDDSSELSPQSGRRDCDNAAVGNVGAGDAEVAPAKPGQQQLPRAQADYRYCFRLIS